jgi:DMSO/TMAO reductase YedYZ molybdopterin-dependent catalytic subunit
VTRRDAIRPPKFADKFALLDFQADPLPIISMFLPPTPYDLPHAVLRVRGDDLRTRMIRWEDLSSLPVYDQEAPIICQIFNWCETARWRGIRLVDFIDHFMFEALSADYLAFHSADGEYFETLSMQEARDPRTMIAFEMDGAPLPHEYGGPIRLLAPFLQGYKSVKWLERILAFKHDPAGIKRLLGQSKTGELGQAWVQRLDIAPVGSPDAGRGLSPAGSVGDHLPM